MAIESKIVASGKIGKVKWFDEKKGFGFVLPDEGGKDIFVHRSAVERSNMLRLIENQTVIYDVQEHKGKLSIYILKPA